MYSRPKVIAQSVLKKNVNELPTLLFTFVTWDCGQFVYGWSSELVMWFGYKKSGSVLVGYFGKKSSTRRAIPDFSGITLFLGITRKYP